jgi:hypothetical protein
MVPYEAVPLNDPALSAITATDATNRIVNAGAFDREGRGTAGPDGKLPAEV